VLQQLDFIKEKQELKSHFASYFLLENQFFYFFYFNVKKKVKRLLT